MACGLSETITTKFLNCSICFETFCDPRALPCQHGFCRECLEQCIDSSKDKQTLICPICRQEVKLSKEGVAKLPVYFLASSLQDTLNMAASAQSIPDLSCSNCNIPGNIATVRCLDCRDYLCENCFAWHRSFKAMKDHKTIPIDDIKAGTVNLEKEEKDRFCTVHGKLYEYYCEIEDRPLCRDCVILNKCPPEHSRISLKEASQIHTDKLKDLLHKNVEVLKKYNNEVSANNQAKQELKLWSKQQNETVENAEKDSINKMKQIFQQLKNDLVCTEKKQMKVLDQIDADLQSSITLMKEPITKTENLIQTESEFEIVSAQSALSRQLQELSTRQPKGANQTKLDKMLDTAIPQIKEQLEGLLKKIAKRQKWQMVNEFNTGEFDKLQGLALDKDGNIAVCSWNKGLKVFSRNGDVQRTLYNSPGALDVAVGSDNKYYSIPKGKRQIQIHRRNTIDTYVNTQVSNVNSLTVDSNSKVIVSHVNKTISIQNTDGSMISKFATQSIPCRLAAITNQSIVISYYDAELKRGTSVQLMDYCGGNVKVIQPPDEVKVWAPAFVCCGRGELFITNSDRGNPSGVYRYTSEGDYLDCVTTEVSHPAGIALSKDGMELYVAEHWDGSVKIFQRP